MKYNKPFIDGLIKNKFNPDIIKIFKIIDEKKYKIHYNGYKSHGKVIALNNFAFVKNVNFKSSARFGVAEVDFRSECEISLYLGGDEILFRIKPIKHLGWSNEWSWREFMFLDIIADLNWIEWNDERKLAVVKTKKDIKKLYKFLSSLHENKY